LNCSNLLDTDESLDTCLGRPNGILGSDFSDLESAQNLLLSILNHFSENDDFEINVILDYVATLHNSNFVKLNAANHKLTN
jgi:hypothetical protein